VGTIIQASDEATTTELLQLAKIMELVGETADIARAEIAQPPPRIGVGPGTWTRTTGFLTRLEAAIVIYERLGGPALPPATRQFSIDAQKLPTNQRRIVSEAEAVLAMLTTFAENASFGAKHPVA
jgi:hypothetical protein